MNRNTPVCIIGCGRIAGHHARAIRSTPGLELASVCDLDVSKANAYAAEFGVPAFADSRDALKALPDGGLVVIATPSGMHFEHAMEIVVEHRRGVIVEKPTVLRHSQFRSLESEAKARRVPVFPVFQNRYNKAVRRVKAALDEGELGRLVSVSVRVRWCRPQRYYDLSAWRGTFAMDGGALTNQGIHHVDLLRHLGGEVEAVCAKMETRGADIEVEDTVVAALRFRSGAVGTLEVTTAARPVDFEASLSFVGEKGLAQLGGIAVNELQTLTTAPGDSSHHSEDFSACVYGNGHLALYADVVSHITGRSQFPVDFQDCRSTLELLHAFYVSDESGGWIRPDEGRESPRLGRPDEKLADLYRTRPRAVP